MSDAPAGPGEEDALVSAVEAHQRRVERARSHRPNPWRTAARVGALGWLIALPPTLGAFLGHLIDARLGGGVTWALALMFLGLAGGGVVLWRSLQDAQREDEP